LCWTIAYYTIYALADREFDLEIGIKSSAFLFGNKVFRYILLFNFLSLLLLIFLGIYCDFNSFVDGGVLLFVVYFSLEI
ncbi:4-hydroxybenzoate octaprenyltransferase, partial [Francisella tularensis subsp. holarctica]|nr:4-hydroxybenzoate octaprenyltransferase [Francisella tularensis subsp. holarctica]